jgi:hypothetical protein
MAEFTTLLYACCDVAVSTRVTWSKTASVKCWYCGVGVPLRYKQLDDSDPLKKFHKDVRVTRPTEATPPWRI